MSDNLGTGKISSLFMKMVIPSVISQLVVLIYNMVDRIFIGHIPDIGSTADRCRRCTSCIHGSGQK